MTTLRYLFATLLFSFGIYLFCDLLQNGFNLKVLFVCIGCFIAAHYIWPPNRDKDEESVLLDILEDVINLPFNILARLLRALANNKDHNQDIDLN